MVVELPNKYTHKMELYVVEVTPNHEHFQDAFKVGNEFGFVNGSKRM